MITVQNKVYKITSIGDRCDYLKFARYFVGKRVTIEDSSVGGVYVSFVFPEDAKPINKANGWSETKNRFLLHGAKLSEFKPKNLAGQANIQQSNNRPNTGKFQRNNRKSEWSSVRGFEGVYECNNRGVIRLVKK